MDKVNCEADDHIWACKEESGFLNEITTFRALSATEISNLKNDIKLESAICPKGAIVCGQCGKYLNKDKTNSISQELKSLKIIKI